MAVHVGNNPDRLPLGLRWDGDTQVSEADHCFSLKLGHPLVDIIQICSTTSSDADVSILLCVRKGLLKDNPGIEEENSQLLRIQKILDGPDGIMELLSLLSGDGA